MVLELEDEIQKMRDHDCLLPKASRSVDVSRLDLVKEKSQENTNDLGLVILDDAVMGVLANVLDDILSKTSKLTR